MAAGLPIVDREPLLRHSRELCQRTRDLCESARATCVHARESIEDARRICARLLDIMSERRQEPPPSR